MVAGYDTRQPGRATFASDGPTPVRVNPSAQDATRAPQMVGGESRSGVISGEASLPGVAGQLGGFFAELLEPHIQARQEEEFNRGRAEQLARQAGDEIQASNGGFSKIFGQSAYVEGAIFYSTQQAASEISGDMSDKQDELKKLTPSELARYLSDKVSERATGNPYTDRMMSAAVFEQSAPVMQIIAKRREVWLRENGTRSFSDFLAAQSDLYQRTASDNAMLSDPADADPALLVQAENNARAAMTKPPGMDDETYVATLKGAYLRALESGNGHMAALMKGAGFLNLLDDAERVRLEDAEDRYADRAYAQILMRPDIQAQYLALVADEADPQPGVTPGDLVRRKLAFNALLKRTSGFDVDLFDHKALASGAASMVSALASERRRQEDHRWQVEAQQAEIAARREDEERRDRLGIAKATAYFLAGRTAEGLLQNVGTVDDYETLGNNAYQAGNYDLLQSNFVHGTTFKKVQGDMQRNIQVAIGGEYGQSVERAYHDWQELRRRSPAMAMEYFGAFDGPMRSFHEMMLGRTIAPSIAFQRAFQDPTRYGPAAIPGGRSKEAQAGIDAAMGDLSAWSILRPLTGSPANLNASSQRAVRSYIEGRLGNLMRNSNVGADRLAKDVLGSALSTGAIERYGPFSIINPANTVPLGNMLGLQNDEATAVIVGLINDKMRAAGFAGGAWGADYDVVRHLDGHNQPVLTVMASDSNGHHTAVIRFAEMQAKARDHVAGNRAVTGQPYNGVDAYRYIPGETRWQRLTRINREVAGGADPVRH